jgi:hypothetical protein
MYYCMLLFMSYLPSAFKWVSDSLLSYLKRLSFILSHATVIMFCNTAR